MDTESQILAALAEQQRLLQQLVWIGAVIALAAVARLVMTFFANRRQLRQEGFSALASPLYMERRFEELWELCRERVASHPSEPSAHWFMGLVRFEQARFEEAVPHFERAQELAPTWGPQVEAYLQRIRQRNVA
jgi:cytochrome c-type biogenesis protein CcmH/NrfG